MGLLQGQEPIATVDSRHECLRSLRIVALGAEKDCCGLADFSWGSEGMGDLTSLSPNGGSN